MNEATPFQTQIVIRTTPETLWNAITNGEITQQYYTLSSRVDSTWEPGAAYQYVGPGEQVLIHGTIEAITPGQEVTMTFNPMFLPEPVRGVESQVTYRLDPVGENVMLKLTHSGLDANLPTTPTITSGWVALVSSLKSFLETGQALSMPVQGQ